MCLLEGNKNVKSRHSTASFFLRNTLSIQALSLSLRACVIHTSMGGHDIYQKQRTKEEEEKKKSYKLSICYKDA